MPGSIHPTPHWLERANRLALITRVLAGTVHDVNNALQVISGSAELLQMVAGAPETVRARGETIGAQARRASALLADLSTFARDTRDRSERVGLKATAARALEMRRYALTKLRVVPVVEGDEQEVAANPRQLLQIVLNLVVNAERALAGVAAPSLELTVAAEGGRAVLTVTDNGRGVPADADSALFEAASGPDGPVEDLGIGLRVSRWLAAEHGGTLRAAANPGGGSRLTLALPASGR